MEETSYKKPFLLALFINCIFFLVMSFLFQNISSVETKHNDLVVQIDMSKYEVPTEKQGNDPSKPKSDPGGSSARLPDLSGKPAPGKVYTPYVGGVEQANVAVRGVATSGEVGDDGGGEGDGTGSDTGSGNGIGNGDGDGIGDGQNGGTGYVDVEGYMARLNSIKTYPQQALRRNLEGSVTFLITFDGSGNLVDYEIISGSRDIFNKAASNLVANGGPIVNTTGKTQRVQITIYYNLQ